MTCKENKLNKTWIILGDFNARVGQCDANINDNRRLQL